jgi:hypothetical protein
MGAGSRSREPSRRLKSEGIDDEEDLTLPANIPLPRGSMSPDKEGNGKSHMRDRATQSPEKEGVGTGATEAEAEGNEASAGGIGNCELSESRGARQPCTDESQIFALHSAPKSSIAPSQSNILCRWCSRTLTDR